MIDISAWPGLQLIEQMIEGNRNEVWRGELAGAVVAVRQSRRSAASLEWELDLIDHVSSLGFLVPTVHRTSTGERSANGVVVQTWITGTPPTTEEQWHAVSAELRRLHAATPDYPQRPGCCSVVELGISRTSVDADIDAMPADVVDQVLAIFGGFADVPVSLIHGDPDPSNIRIADEGVVGLLDWDESRVDLIWHDLSNLGVQVLSGPDHQRAQRLSNAWEAANGWIAEPEYARRRLADLD